MPDADDLFDEVASLPDPTLAPEAAARIHRRARREFVRRAGFGRSRLVARLERLYAAALEPTLAVGITVTYLGWAALRVLDLYR